MLTQASTASDITTQTKNCGLQDANERHKHFKCQSAYIGKLPWAINVAFIFVWKNQRRVRLTRLFEVLRLLRGCGRRSCCCRCLVVGKVAFVPIVFCVCG